MPKKRENTQIIENVLDILHNSRIRAMLILFKEKLTQTEFKEQKFEGEYCRFENFVS